MIRYKIDETSHQHQDHRLYYKDVRLCGARVVTASKQRRRYRYIYHATDFSKHSANATDRADVVGRELHRRVVRRG